MGEKYFNVWVIIIIIITIVDIGIMIPSTYVFSISPIPQRTCRYTDANTGFALSLLVVKDISICIIYLQFYVILVFRK